MEIVKFKPLTKEEAQLARNPLFQKGQYSFEVVNAEKKTSQSGNLMIVVKLRFIDFINGNTRSTLVNDYLLTTGAMEYKLRDFCESIGMITEYEKGELCPDYMVKKTGIAELIIQEDKTGKYPPKNVVKDYVIMGEESRKNLEKTIVDDDLPF